MRVYAELWPDRPRWGVWAWWAQRITGVLLVAYAVWHIVTVAYAARSPERLGPLLLFLRNPTLFVLLLIGLAYHSANGVRLVLFDLGVDAMRGRPAFWGFFVVAVVIVIAGVSRGVLGLP